MKLIITFLFLILTIQSQDLSGVKICLDPGHGFVPGQASQCSDAETKRFESYINHIVVPYLKQYLLSYNATIITTRADYDSISPCITLTQRKAIANNNNVHFFHSVHHNAFNGTSNYSLSLFKQNNNQVCPNGNPAWPGQADAMANIQAGRLNSALQTTSGIHRGDMCFLGFNLGVLSTLNMPGTLSEASFFDFPAEKLRLQNLDYLRTEAEALFHSFLQYYNKPIPEHGSLVGIVTDMTSNQPAKNVKVRIHSINKEYIVDNIGNGFYRLDSLQAGTYQVSVIGPMDTTTTSVNILASRINVRNLAITRTEVVGNVKLRTVIGQAGALQATWEKPSGTVDSYYVWLSQDPNQFPDTITRYVAGNATGTVFIGLEQNKSYYIRVKAKNNISESPNYSKVYGTYTAGPIVKVLIVDGFNRFGNNGSLNSPDHNLATFYSEGLKQINLKFETVSNSAVNNINQFYPYKYVIWFVGDESTEDESFSTAEQEIIKNYLKGGGKLFITGSEIAWDLDQNGTATDKSFFNNYLKAQYIADNPTPNVASVIGVQNSFFDNMNFSFGQVYPDDSPDVINPINGSVPILKYNETQIAAHSFEGTFPEGTQEGKLVYIGFGVESISDLNIRNEIIQKISEFFIGTTNVENEFNIIPDNFSLNVYPNPFNPSTNILINISESSVYNISVFNILGEKIFEIENGELQPGSYKYNLNFDEYSSGIYIVNVISDKFNTSKKIMFMK